MAKSNCPRSRGAGRLHAFIETIEPRQLMSAVVFQVDPSRSSVSVSGHVSTFPLQEQAPGSLATHYAGTIAADVEAGSITFPGGSAVAAQNNGSWQPGNAPGNYGAKFNTGLLGTEFVAARGISLDLTSGALPVSGTGSFDLNSATVKFLAGTIDYAPVTSGSSDLTGESGQQQTADLAQYSVSGNTATLVLPVHVTVAQTFLTPNDSELTLSGEVVATANIAPEVASASFQFDRLPQTLAFTFTQDVSASLSPAALQLVNLTTAQTVVPDGLQYSAGNVATFRFDHPLPDGRYRATLLSSAVSNATGVHLGNGSDYTYDFFTLTADVNHDGSVGFSDLLILAQHYGQSNATFSAGDVNYDGSVGFADLLLLAQNYGKSLPNPTAASLTDPLSLIRAGRARVHL